MSKAAHSDINFLKEAPLKNSEDFKRLKFGHRELADNVASIVAQCDTPFTIGLFGKWGSGKSSISYLTADILRASDIPSVIFDVWKHEGDSLRRSFLKELVNQMKSLENDNLDSTFELDDRLESSVKKYNEGRFTVNWKKVKQFTTTLVIIAIAIVIAIATMILFGLYSLLLSTIIPIISFLFGGGFLLWLLKNATQFLATETTTFSKEKLHDPHEFESEFTRIIQATKKQRSLIIFDNLDRVTHVKAIEAFSTIKTFLEPSDKKIKEKDIVFLIPCDDAAIRAHIANVYLNSDYSNGAFDADEFLKKFFNTILWIPDFIPSELEAFAGSCLKEINCTELDDPSIAWMITKAYRENPRQIIQFVNILLSNYLLITSREGDEKDFEEGYAEKHKKEICLYLILIHTFPEAMANVRRSRITNLTTYIEQHKDDDTERKREQFDSFKRFVTEISSEVMLANLRPFYSLRISEQEKQFPGIEQLYTLFEDNKITEAIKLLGDIAPDIADRIDDFGGAITTELENKTNPTAIAFFINSLLHVIQHYSLALRQPHYTVLFNSIKNKMRDKLDILAPSVTNGTLLKHCPHFTGEMTSMWIARIKEIVSDETIKQKTERFQYDLIATLTTITTIDSDAVNSLREILNGHYATNTNVVSQLTSHDVKQTDFVGQSFVKKFADSISEYDLLLLDESGDSPTYIPKRVLLLNKFDVKLIDIATITASLQKLTKILTTQISNGWKEENVLKWRGVFNGIADFAEKHEIVDSSNVAERQQLSQAVIQAFNTIPDWENKRYIIRLIERAIEFAPDAGKAQLEQFITQIFSNLSLEGITLVIDEIDNPEEYITQAPQNTVLHSRAVADISIYRLLYANLSEEERAEWNLAFLEQNISSALKFIEEMEYDIPDKELFLRRLAELTPSQTPANKKGCYKVLNDTKCNENVEITDIYEKQIIELLTRPDAKQQNVGYEAIINQQFLGNVRRRNIVQQVVDWLFNLPSEQRYQRYSLLSVKMWVDSLNTQEKGKLAQLCFDDLIRKSKDIDSINLAFEILEVLEPLYSDSDRKVNYEDIKRMYENETDDSIKRAIASGLLRLKPDNLRSGEKEYWNWVESIQSVED
jgi:hypothetical protein